MCSFSAALRAQSRTVFSVNIAFVNAKNQPFADSGLGKTNRGNTSKFASSGALILRTLRTRRCASGVRSFKNISS